MKYLIALMMMGCVTTPEYERCLKCPETDIVDYAEGVYDERDVPAKARSEWHCKTNMKINQCLVQFIRIEPGRYHSVCGPRREAICRKVGN